MEGPYKPSGSLSKLTSRKDAGVDTNVPAEGAIAPSGPLKPKKIKVVWIVNYYGTPDIRIPVRVFSSQEKAKEYIQEQGDRKGAYKAEEFELD
jgi:hypothetical protein